MTKSEIHSGYEFEEGMFSRMRTWVDVAPWIRLFRVMRILASPTHVGLVAIALVIIHVLFGSWPWSVLQGYTVFDLELVGISPLQSAIAEQGLRALMYAVVSLLIWTPVFQFVARAGASLTAQQQLPPARVTAGIVVSRWWKSYLVPLVPLCCILGFSLLLFLVRIPSFVLPFQWVSTLTGWVIGIGSIPLGILGFGALFAVPLGIVAMACEPDPDPIDSTSRGYEYLYRRPLRLLWYLLVSALVITIAARLLGGVAMVSSVAVAEISSLFRLDTTQIAASHLVIAIVLTSWKIALSFGLLGGIYLLARRDTGGQEVEDFWVPPTKPPPPLPELPDEAYQS